MFNIHIQIFKIFDTDGNGIVDFREFMMATATTALFLMLQALEKIILEGSKGHDYLMTMVNLALLDLTILVFEILDVYLR